MSDWSSNILAEGSNLPNAMSFIGSIEAPDTDVVFTRGKVF